VRANWRFQQALYRAYYDAYNRARALHEAALEQQAAAALRQAPRTGSREAIRRAAAALDRAAGEPVAQDLRARVFELAEALFQSVRMQLSVERYQAIAAGRGANLDSIDTPLNDAPWLRSEFKRILALADEKARLAGIDAIVNWENPGPGGFYDDLGNPANMPHLVRGPGYPTDPAFLESSLVAFQAERGRPEAPLRNSWIRYAAALNDAPLEMRYRDLDPAARYRVRVTYGGERTSARIRMVAGNGIEVHPFRAKDFPPRPVEFAVPEEATGGGTLTLRWEKEPGGGGPGRGLEIAEVWLIRDHPD
jgi:hypothetical protein